MFNLSFTSAVAPGSENGEEEKAMDTPPPVCKRSRRRRNVKSRKTRVEPMEASVSAKKHHDAPMTKSDIYFALDCEMVGVGPEGFDSAVARVTVVNWENTVVLDTFVKVPVPVIDYRTYISGIQPADIESENAMSFEEARSAVENILRGKILIGHGLENDLCALGLTHPWCDVRDSAQYAHYMRECVDPQTGKLVLRPRKLRDLTWEILGRQIQYGGRAHCPMEDAIAALDLYKAMRRQWEEDLIQQQQQREKARESENQRLRMKSYLFANSVNMPPPNLYGPNMHMLAPQVVDPTRQVGPYAMEYAPMRYPIQTAPPPPPSSPSSSWFRFGQSSQSFFVFPRRPRTPEPLVSEPSCPQPSDDCVPDMRQLSLDSQESLEESSSVMAS